MMSSWPGWPGNGLQQPCPLFADRSPSLSRAFKNTKALRKRMSKPSRFDFGWVVVGAGALMTCVGFGTMLSLAVFLQPISETMGWSRAGVSAAAALELLCMGEAAFFRGSLLVR